LLFGFAFYNVAEGVGVGKVAFILVRYAGEVLGKHDAVAELNRVVFGNAVVKANSVGYGFAVPYIVLAAGHKGYGCAGAYFAFEESFAESHRRPYAKQFEGGRLRIQYIERWRGGKANFDSRKRVTYIGINGAVFRKARGYFIKVIEPRIRHRGKNIVHQFGVYNGVMRSKHNALL
jgi:hypothetical protein